MRACVCLYFCVPSRKRNAVIEEVDTTSAAKKSKGDNEDEKKLKVKETTLVQNTSVSVCAGAK